MERQTTCSVDNGDEVKDNRDDGDDDDDDDDIDDAIPTTTGTMNFEGIGTNCSSNLERVLAHSRTLAGMVRNSTGGTNKNGATNHLRRRIRLQKFGYTRLQITTNHRSMN